MSLTIKDMSSGYEQLVLKNLNVEILKNSFTILLGPNGCGKSTLLKSMARILTPASGSIEIDNQNILKQSGQEIAKVLSYLPQNPLVPSGITVEQLVGYGRAPYQSFFGTRGPKDLKMIEHALEVTGVKALRHQALTELSGGQRQRVFIAMSIAQDSDYMLLDEPTTFLDIRFQFETLELLKDLNRQGKTIIAVLHDIPQAARYGSQLIIMNKGQIQAHGRPQDIIDTQMIESVFGLKCRVYSDPVTATPTISPIL